MRSLLFGCAVLSVGALPALAAPDPDCAWKFIGTWRSTFIPNGQVSTAIIKADGTQSVRCADAVCVSSQNWSCKGDTHIVGFAHSKLSSNGKRMTWKLGYSDRLTSVPAGLVGGGKDALTGFTIRGDKNANGLGNSFMAAGAAAEQYCTYADQIKAAEAYTSAARFYEKAGNAPMQRKALAGVKRVAAKADYCEANQKRKVQRKANPTKKSPKDNTARCDALKKHIKLMEKRSKGGDENAKKFNSDVLKKLKADIKKVGC